MISSEGSKAFAADVRSPETGKNYVTTGKKCIKKHRLHISG